MQMSASPPPERPPVRLGRSALRALSTAQGIAQERGERRITTAHLLLALVSDDTSPFRPVFAAHHLSPGRVRNAINDISRAPQRRVKSLPMLRPTAELRTVFGQASAEAAEQGVSQISSHALAVALLTSASTEHSVRVLRMLDVDRAELLNDLKSGVQETDSLDAEGE